MKVRELDERRIGHLSDACDRIDEERPRGDGWKARHDAAYAALARACNFAATPHQHGAGNGEKHGG